MKRPSMKAAGYGVLVLALALSAPAAGDPMLPIETDLDGFVHQITETVDSGSLRIRQTVYPVQVRVPVPGGTLEAHSALMKVEQQIDSTVVDVWGPLDTRFSGVWKLGDVGLLSLHASLPTGKDSLDAAQEGLVRGIARNDLNFPVSSFGNGFDFGGGLSLAFQREHLGYSIGLGYVRRGKYDPIDGVSDYKPGDEGSLTLGMDYTWNRWVGRLTAVASVYLDDELGGRAIYRNGKQGLVQAGVYYEGRRLRLKGELYDIVRFRNRQLIDNQFLYEIRDSNGNEFRGEVEASWTPTPVLSVFARLHLKHLSPDDRPADDPRRLGRARLYGGGGGISVSLNRSAHLVFRVNQWKGSARDGMSHLSAYNIKVALSLQL